MARKSGFFAFVLIGIALSSALMGAQSASRHKKQTVVRVTSSPT